MTEAGKPSEVAVEVPRDPVAPAGRTLGDYAALAIATCGVGYLPLAPGTWGSLVGVAFFLSLRDPLWSFVDIWNGVPQSPEFFLLKANYSVIALELVIVLVIGLIGTWAASRTEKLSVRKDPGKVVIDEVVGQYIALLPMPFVVRFPGWPFIILAFVLFRFFDIVKPYPARKLELLHGGLGIMADDVVAGMYAAIVVAVAIMISFFI